MSDALPQVSDDLPSTVDVAAAEPAVDEHAAAIAEVRALHARLLDALPVERREGAAALVLQQLLLAAVEVLAELNRAGLINDDSRSAIASAAVAAIGPLDVEAAAPLPGTPMRSTYSSEMADEICRRLAGGELLKEACAPEGMPHPSTVRGWALDDRDGFAAKLQRAWELHWHSRAEELIAVARDGRQDWIEVTRKSGTVLELHRAHFERVRLYVDTLKWALSRILPKHYGERTAVEHSGADGGPIQAEVDTTELARQVAFLLSAGLQEPRVPRLAPPILAATPASLETTNGKAVH